MFYRNGRKIYTSENGRKSLRLKGYDYSQEGLYFITICCQDRAHLFGEIQNGEMKLNDAGRMVQKWYFEMENKFPDLKCHEMVVMPNHLHCLLEKTRRPAWADHAGSSPRGRPGCGRPKYGPENIKYGASIPEIMDWFKTMTTNEYIRGVKILKWKKFNRKIWQRSYHDHIIRNQRHHNNVINYINNNPKKWEEDKFNKEE